MYCVESLRNKKRWSGSVSRKVVAVVQGGADKKWIIAREVVSEFYGLSVEKDGAYDFGAFCMVDANALNVLGFRAFKRRESYARNVCGFTHQGRERVSTWGFTQEYRWENPRRS
ncbi:hypothetical protein DM860_017579 [Cuscuta australis]|uniref:Uncharacterized protein n=1 Tax=Cuscuta australis TaxID=267555 RepID=A0A328DDX7_9ASTE|nr:hypothetical protein DM860_017579 [Cuscuta australis]